MLKSNLLNWWWSYLIVTFAVVKLLKRFCIADTLDNGNVSFATFSLFRHMWNTNTILVIQNVKVYMFKYFNSGKEKLKRALSKKQSIACPSLISKKQTDRRLLFDWKMLICFAAQVYCLTGCILQVFRTLKILSLFFFLFKRTFLLKVLISLADWRVFLFK